MRYRPIRENYPRGIYGDIDYYERLERYCTYLENKNKALSEQFNNLEENTDRRDKKLQISGIAECFSYKEFLYETFTNESEYKLKITHIPSGLSVNNYDIKIPSQHLTREFLLMKLIVMIVEKNGL